MTVTTTRLGQAAGIGTAVAGAIFVAVQVNHPAMEVASVTTASWVIRSAAKTVMAALVLAGITAMYLRQREKVGLLGLAGYLLLSAGYFLMFGTEYLAGFVLPGASGAAPGYVNDVIVAAFGGKASGDIGSLGTVFAATGICYVLGGLLFGIATFRAGILWRWAAVLLAVGNVSTLALSVLPGSFNRPMAVPTGVALIGLGVSLWRDQRREAVRSSAEPAASGAPEASGTAPVVAPHAQAAVR
jgi:hypothetical protein